MRPLLTVGPQLWKKERGKESLLSICPTPPGGSHFWNIFPRNRQCTALTHTHTYITWKHIFIEEYFAKNVYWYLDLCSTSPYRYCLISKYNFTISFYGDVILFPVVPVPIAMMQWQNLRWARSVGPTSCFALNFIHFSFFPRRNKRIQQINNNIDELLTQVLRYRINIFISVMKKRKYWTNKHPITFTQVSCLAWKLVNFNNTKDKNENRADRE